MGYISSGRFRADLEAATGQALDGAAADVDVEQDKPLEPFPAELRRELAALRDLFWSNPTATRLCVLTSGDFCSVPALTDDDRETVLDDWFDGDAVTTDFVMTAIDVVNGGGGFYVVVAPDGRLGLVCEDPYGFDSIACTLEQFLQALIAAHRAVCTRGLAAAKAELVKVVDDRTAKLLLTFAGRLAPAAP